MDIHHIRHSIQARRKKGEIYQSIADDLNINKAMVWQIEHGYIPGKKVSEILQLDPNPELKYTRSRRERLDEIAKEWGFSSWCAYETNTLNNQKAKESLDHTEKV